MLHPMQQAKISDFLKSRARKSRTRRMVIEMTVLLVFVITYFFVSTSINNTELSYESTSNVRELLLNSVYDEGGGGGGERRRLRQVREQRPSKRRGRASPLRSGRATGRRGRRLRAGGGDDDDEEATVFSGLLDKDSVWDFLSNNLGPGIFGGDAEFPSLDSTGCREGNGQPGGRCDERSNYLLQSHRLLGAIRISQARINSGSSEGEDLSGALQSDGGCSVPAIYSSSRLVETRGGESSSIIIPTCYPDEEDMEATWKLSDFGLSPNGTAPPFSIVEPTRKQERLATSLSAKVGRVFVEDIPSDANLTQWQQRIEELQAQGFIDMHTRFVYVSMNVYNVATDLFLCIELRFNFAHSGGVWTEGVIRPLSFNRHLHILYQDKSSADDSRESVAKLVLEFFFLFFLLISLIMQVTGFYEDGLLYLASPYNWFSFGNIYLFAWIEGRRFKLVYELIAIISVYTRGDKTSFMPLFPLAENAFYTQNLLAVNSLLMLTLVFKFLELSPKLNVLTQTLVHASGEMFWFMVLFFNLLLSYCMAFYLCFGMDVSAFSSVSETVYSLISVLLGAFNFEKLVEYNAFVGPFLYWTYVLIMFFFILASFVAIIEEAFNKAKEMGRVRNERAADEFEAKMRARFRGARRLERRLQRFAQKTRSTKMLGAKVSLRARENYGFQPKSRLAEMTEAVKNVLGRARLPGQGAKPEDERIRKVAWSELHVRHKATHELMAHLHKARRQQGVLLEKVAQQKQREMVQLEELSTQLWNCWQLVSDAKRMPRAPKTEAELEAERKAAVEKDLSKQGLTELPESALSVLVKQIEASDNLIEEVTAGIAAAINLEELLLYKNKVRTVDPAIGQLRKLKVLNLFNQGVLAKLPWAELGGLGALEELNLAANKISVIPDAAFAGLSSLKVLSINDNRLVRLGSLKPLKLLEELRLYNNNLEEMPDIGMMPRLTVLELNKNLIAAIPSGYFANTPAIEKLILSANLLAVVPASLASCASLQFLQLQDNKLKSFEEAGWHELVQLETLFLQGNPALTVPASLGRCAALKRINVPSATNKLDGTFRMLALSTPGGKYWDKKGKAIETPMH